MQLENDKEIELKLIRNFDAISLSIPQFSLYFPVYFPIHQSIVIIFIEFLNFSSRPRRGRKINRKDESLRQYGTEPKVHLILYSDVFPCCLSILMLWQCGSDRTSLTKA